MHHHSSSATSPPHVERERPAAIAIAAAAIVSTVAVAMDSSAGGHNPLEILQGIAALQSQKELVHGIAMACICAMAYGYAALARRLDLRRTTVLAGLLCYLFGCIAMLGATLLDGFIVTHLAVDGAHAAPERTAFAYNLIHYADVALNDAAKLGWVLQAVGTLGWSLQLLRLRGLARATGGVGLLSSGLVVALVAVADTYLGMTALLSILVAQLLWNLAAAVLLYRGSGSASPISTPDAATTIRLEQGS
jgi:hypothetical protein